MSKATVIRRVNRVIVSTPGPQGPSGLGVSGTGLLSVTDGVQDTPSTLSARVAADASNLRTQLGLGDSATRSVGTASGTVAAGNDSRFSDARTPTAHTHPLSELTQSGATPGQVPQWNGSAWAPGTPTSGGIDYTCNTTAGTYTWTNPSPSTRRPVRIRLVGGGSGGGSGRKGAAGTVRCGGGGGAAGATHEVWAWTDELPATVSYTVGAGGAGGAAVSASSTNQTANLSGSYFYDIEIESESGVVTRLAQGSLTASKEITRE